ncbi:MAG: hypothetical protein AAGU19_18740 [Prolixibacteraceae bacterium]
MNKNQFAIKLGVHPTVVHNIVDDNGRKNEPSFKFLSKLMSSFEDINGDWLLTGRGDIFRSKEATLTPEKILNPLQEIEELKKDKTVLAEQIVLKDQQIQRLWREIDKFEKGT